MSAPFPTGFVLCKENMETHDAINALSRHLHLRPHQFAFAGLKDKRAQTWQHLTVEGISCKKYVNNSVIAVAATGDRCLVLALPFVLSRTFGKKIL